MNRKENVENIQRKVARQYESLMKRREYQRKFQEERRVRLLDPKLNSDEQIAEYKKKWPKPDVVVKIRKKESLSFKSLWR